MKEVRVSDATAKKIKKMPSWQKAGLSTGAKVPVDKNDPNRADRLLRKF